MSEGRSSGSTGRSGYYEPRFLHRAVADDLRDRIVRGGIPAGFKLPSMRELAAEFGVSLVTVNRALQLLEEENHVYRVAGVGVFVRPPAASPPPTRKLLTLAVGNLVGAFDTGVARGVERACQEYGWGTQILSAHLSSTQEKQNFTQLFDCGAHGAIILPLVDSVAQGELMRACQSGRPVVVLDKFVPGLQADFVSPDHEGGSYLATRYLLERGHRHIVHLTISASVSSVVARYHGFLRAMAEAGLPPGPDDVILASSDPETERQFKRGRLWLPGKLAIMSRLESCPKPVAVFALDCYLTWGVYRACEELGLRIPEDVSVIAFDDAEFADAIQPPMTIVRQRTDELGRVAVQLLMERLEGDGPSPGGPTELRHRIVGVDLVERQSVADLREPARPGNQG